MIGLNIPFHTWLEKPLSRFSSHQEIFDYFAARLHELGVKAVRIPVLWNYLQPYDSEKKKLVVNRQQEELYDQILSSLPRDVSVLGSLLHPPQQVAVDYFYDQSSMAHYFSEFSGYCARRFSRIEEWEIWNEPNASDFYLSVLDGQGHRPWNAEEFVRDIFLPGARAVKNVNPRAKVCFPGVEENGIVGHRDKKPALSNRLPRSDQFNRLREAGGHAHLYFIPDFLPSLLEQLKGVLDDIEKKKLVDACALHPYPYFKIPQDDSIDLVERSSGLVDDFLKLYEEFGLKDIDIWITEVGCSSFQPHCRNYRDEVQQAAFYKMFPERIRLGDRISRIYWYKLLDAPFDLRQEKTFGLLDHEGIPKLAFYTLKSFNSSASEANLFMQDDFWYGSKNPKGGLDPAFWETKSSSNFSFITSSVDASGSSYVTLFPGRYKGDWLILETKNFLTVKDEGHISCDVDFSISSPVIGAIIKLSAVSRSTGQKAFCVEILTQPNNDICIKVMGQKEEMFVSRKSYKFAIPEELTGVGVDFIGDKLLLLVKFKDVMVYRTFYTDSFIKEGEYKMNLHFQKLDRMRGFINLYRFKCLSNDSESRTKMLPADHFLPVKEWNVDLPSNSQINQDEFVLRMFNYKRGGVFVEIGGDDGVGNSNSYQLETRFDWKGIIVEANPRLYAQVCKNRGCICSNYAIFKESGQNLEFVDAGAVGGLIDHLQDDIHAAKRKYLMQQGHIIKVSTIRGDELLSRYNMPRIIEYMSIDTEGSEVEVLKSIDFSVWNVCFLTIEHAGNKKKREEVRGILEPYGYRFQRVWFEDWYYHPDHLSKALGLSLDETLTHINTVFAWSPYIRRCRLFEKAREARREGRYDEALSLYEEGTKPYYPDNIEAFIGVSLEMRRQKKYERAFDVLRRAERQRPTHRGVLRQLIFLLCDMGKIGQMIPRLERMLNHYPDILKDEDFVECLKNVRSKMSLYFEREVAAGKRFGKVFQFLNDIQ